MFAIKAEVSDPWAETFAFSDHKTMYGGKRIAKGDRIFVFASENGGGPGLIASGVITSAKVIANKREDRPANAAGKRHRQTYRAREAALGPERAQIFFATGTTVDPRPSSISNFIVRQ
jgi:hypothetical protein